MERGQVFSASETHRRISRAGNRLVLHSEDAGWQSLHAAVFEEAPFHATEPPVGHAFLIYHIAHPTRVTRQVESEQRESALIGPRQVCITPGNAETFWRHAGHPEILQVYLRDAVLRQTCEEICGGDGAGIEIVPRFAISDPLLEQLALAIVAALEDGRTEDTLYVDTMARMMAAHLARKHSTRVAAERPVASDGLTRQRLNRLLAYIEEHLGDDLTLKRMAVEIELSPFYLARVFKSEIGKSPHQYVIERRIARARALLRDTSLPIADVALTTGFSSQSHLSTWFRRLVGVSPACYRSKC
ncbi:MAG: AraC family transcriptional regulator [Gammaproteobacteria bacterium]|jgi:AraC family transcriptional regulator